MAGPTTVRKAGAISSQYSHHVTVGMTSTEKSDICARPVLNSRLPKLQIYLDSAALIKDLQKDVVLSRTSFKNMTV